MFEFAASLLCPVSKLRSTPAAVRFFEFLMALFASETKEYSKHGIWNLMAAKSTADITTYLQNPIDLMLGRRAMSF